MTLRKEAAKTGKAICTKIGCPDIQKDSRTEVHNHCKVVAPATDAWEPRSADTAVVISA